MIFEGRVAAPPSGALVDFRDALEEASATARAERGGAPAVATTAAPAPSVPTTTLPPTVVQPAPAAPAQPAATFENADAPVKAEPLP
jgi:hypothetical protein